MQGTLKKLQIFFFRLIVGNTYQYLTPLPGEEAEDTFRYKWQVYVRAPPGDPDAATFLQSVTFVLDESYSPHHIITLKLACTLSSQSLFPYSVQKPLTIDRYLVP